ncbi:MAG TPA: hypothetical protein DEQ34_04215 [Balneolaceae bacterium]|nr:hypothetical protein [Balneolaceae bacterium]|tara:strand:- start:63 stop:767 length:705 start_codon:yes stop_codon:yes gene_type:complete
MPLVAYIPISTTLFSLYFIYVIYTHWRRKPEAMYLLWWTIGVITYAAGTTVESIHTIYGWSPFVFKAWYIAGAFLGGVPLAQGTIYLLMKKKTADILTSILVVVLIISSILVILSPLDETVVSEKLNGNVLEWTFIRYITPFINIYAVIFLVGGAFYSAWKYFKNREFRGRFWGNVLIAIGGILPGIGGTMTKMGHTYVLYVTELLGILFIFAGYQVIRNDRSLSIHENQVTTS